jgi:hypothetical protein|tara:strand:- start:4989 stop:5447 length:459 start_codon:yes stop_codon:yes gene_type:complete
VNKKFPKLILLSLLISSLSGQIYSSQEEEVVEFIKNWAALEGDLDAQAQLIRDDRVMISGANKWPDQSDNLMIQKERRSATLKRDPNWKIIQTIISPEVRIYGNVAVAHFQRRFDFIAGEGEVSPPAFNNATMILVKDKGKWGISHTHFSQI